MERVNKDLPKGVKTFVPYSSKEFLDASIDKVKHYTDILLLWEGFTEFIETNEICVKKKYEKVMNKSDYSTSIAVSKK